MATYLTYFDSNYLARGIVMIDSLRSFVPDRDIVVFAVDRETETLLGRLYGSDIRVLAPDYVDQRWPQPKPSGTVRKVWDAIVRRKPRTDPTHWERLAARKPCLMHSVLAEEVRADALLVYIDADTQFFSSPEPALNLMNAASIGISPHAFSQKHTALLKYGEFNAGFLIVRKDEVGLTCMRDWAADCLEWCALKAQDGKFMNQGYLTSWPSRYPNVVNLCHAGLNLAPWNFDGRTLITSGEKITINEVPLIFYHFHQMKRTDGVWHNASGLINVDDHTSLFEHIYDPHVDLLATAEANLMALGFDASTGSIGNRL